MLHLSNYYDRDLYWWFFAFFHFFCIFLFAVSAVLSLVLGLCLAMFHSQLTAEIPRGPFIFLVFVETESVAVSAHQTTKPLTTVAVRQAISCHF